MKIEVKVEVTNETVPTRKGGKMQVCYVETGGKYPEQVNLYCRDGALRAPGMYVATRIKKSGYDFVLDFDSLQAVKAAA